VKHNKCCFSPYFKYDLQDSTEIMENSTSISIVFSFYSGPSFNVLSCVSLLSFVCFFFCLFYLDELDPLACSHSELLEKLRILYTLGRTSWTEDQPIARPYVHRRNEHKNKANIHASNTIRTHDPSVWQNEDLSCLRTHSHCVRLVCVLLSKIPFFWLCDIL
jgi:hypothetical protein